MAKGKNALHTVLDKNGEGITARWLSLQRKSLKAGEAETSDLAEQSTPVREGAAIRGCVG